MAKPTQIEIGLSAAIVAAAGQTPLILTVRSEDPAEGREPAWLPFGQFDPLHHRTLEIGLRAWVGELTNLNLGYAEQLYTFGDRGRHMQAGDSGPHVMSVGYLALTRLNSESDQNTEGHGGSNPVGTRWMPWYDFFPWEDWRGGRPKILDETLLPLLRAWSHEPPVAGSPPRAFGRRERLVLAFGEDDAPWDEEKILERYEILYEAGLVEEALRDGREAASVRPSLPHAGLSMRYDHRRILATAISRLRSKLKYRPIIFELMPETFTLTELQGLVEAISGRHLHKQNFRRLVEGSALVEATGATSTKTGGRPAALYRFRRDIVKERPTPGLRVGSRG